MQEGQDFKYLFCDYIQWGISSNCSLVFYKAPVISMN